MQWVLFDFMGFHVYVFLIIEFIGILLGLNWIAWDSKEVSWNVVEFHRL